MDIEKYIAGKTAGISKVELQGASTLLVKWPGGFNESDGTAKPAVEQGFQLADLADMRQTAVDAVAAAQQALADAQARVAKFDTLLADVSKVKVP